MPRVGDLVQDRAGRWMTWAPTHCTNGHPLGGGQVLVGHLACDGGRGGHTTWTCRACLAVTYGPAIGAHCHPLNGPADVRNL